MTRSVILDISKGRKTKRHGGALSGHALNFDAAAAQCPYDRPSVMSWKHDVQNDEADVFFRGREMKSILAVAGNIDREPVFFQAFFEKIGCFLFIFNDQDTHRHQLPSSSNGSVQQMPGIRGQRIFQSLKNDIRSDGPGRGAFVARRPARIDLR